MIDYLYRIVPVFRDITGRSAFGDQPLLTYVDLQSQWCINARFERQLVLATMKEF
jgi:hypothetical protein